MEYFVDVYIQKLLKIFFTNLCSVVLLTFTPETSVSTSRLRTKILSVQYTGPVP